MLSIFSYIRDGDYMSALIVVLSRCFVVFCCLPIHELFHALAANKLGDNTAKLQGRLTLNPFAHLTPIGTIMIFIFGIGYANPVPVNANNFKKPKRDMALTALAGPVANILMAFVSIFAAYLVAFISNGRSGFAEAVTMFFYFSAEVNLTLAVFNLLPIPPLDGSKILAAVLPYKTYVKYMQYEKYVMIGLMLLLFTGALSTPILYLSEGLMKVISIIPKLLFGLLLNFR